MSGILRVKDWKQHQHYKQRRPPWIKLHRGLLDDQAYQDLDDGAARLLTEVWLVASESETRGTLPFDSAALAWRLRKSVHGVRDGLQALIRAGFLKAEGHDASSALALGLHDAMPETETETEERTTRPSARAEDTISGALKQGSFAMLMGLVRTHLYVPDGKPPADWDEARDGSILKQLRQRYSERDLAIAIEGLAIVRDRPGVFADPVDWLQRSAKVTLRALYNTRSGVLPMWSIATQAYWKHANSRPKGDKRQAESIGATLRALST